MTLDTVEELFGRRLYTLRTSRGFTRSELGTRVDETESTISGWERGLNPPPLPLVRRLEAVLSVYPNYLVVTPDDLTDEELVDYRKRS